MFGIQVGTPLCNKLQLIQLLIVHCRIQITSFLVDTKHNKVSLHARLFAHFEIQKVQSFHSFSEMKARYHFKFKGNNQCWLFKGCCLFVKCISATHHIPNFHSNLVAFLHYKRAHSWRCASLTQNFYSNIKVRKTKKKYCWIRCTFILDLLNNIKIEHL